MKIRLFRAILCCAALIGLGWLGWRVTDKLRATSGGPKKARRAPTPVAAAPIEIGAIELRRSFSGTLEAPASFEVSPKVSGRVEELSVDLSDAVTRGQVVARLDSAEYVQAVEQARADGAVAEARLEAARSAREIAARELERAEALFERGLINDIDRLRAKAEHLASLAAIKVAEAELARGAAALRMAKIRLDYTKVAAAWSDDGAGRIVARRFVNAGDSVTPSTPILSLVQLAPIHGIIYVTERDYGRMRVGQAVALVTDAYPGETFQGVVRRIAPVFQRSSRQARVELELANGDLRLKPGMFIRATVVLEQLRDAAIVSDLALCNRGDQDGVFVLSADRRRVSWRPVRIGIRQGDRVQVIGEGLAGEVVTLGQQLIEDGAEVSVVEAPGGARR